MPQRKVMGIEVISKPSGRKRGDTAIWEAAMFPPNRGIAAFAVLASSAAGAVAEPATIATKANLRSGPGAAFDVIAVIPQGSRLDVQKCGELWCRVKFGHLSGYASRAFLKPGADVHASAPPQQATAPEPKATLIGPYIWDWNNPEQRDRAWRSIQLHNQRR